MPRIRKHTRALRGRYLNWRFGRLADWERDEVAKIARDIRSGSFWDDEDDLVPVRYTRHGLPVCSRPEHLALLIVKSRAVPDAASAMRRHLREDEEYYRIKFAKEDGQVRHV